jgi:hypothetical protein
MAFPRKFKHLLELKQDDVQFPDAVLLTYAVCACVPEACGWGGWMIEAAFENTSATGDLPAMAPSLPVSDVQRCPRCGRETFRTGVQRVYVPSADRTLMDTSDIDLAPLEYHE